MAQEVETPRRANTTLIDVKGLKVHFPIKGGILGRTVANVKAVDGVDLSCDMARRWDWWAKAAAANPRPVALSYS